MFRILAGGATAFLFSASVFALTPHDELVSACTEDGNDAAECSCAANVIIETLEENELDFMLAVMEADTNEPESVMSIAAEHGLDMTGIMLMGQKMQTAEPEMRELCGIDTSE